MPGLNDLWREFHDFKQQYEQRHSLMLERLAKLEAQAPTWARSEDLATLKETIRAFKELVEGNKVYLDKTMEQMEKTATATMEQFEKATEAMATKTDVDWLKRAFWALVAGLISLGVALAVHVFQFMQSFPGK